MEKEVKQSGVAAVERAFSILNAFKAGDMSLSLQNLATRTGMYKSTILRLISTLIQEHAIVRLDDGTYQLGSMLLHWGGLYQASLNLDDHVPAVLKRLVQQTGEGASFFTREDKIRVCLFRVDSSKSIRDQISHAVNLFDMASKYADVMPTDDLVELLDCIHSAAGA